MKVEKASLHDILQIHQLVNHFARRGELLPRPLSELYENIRDFFVIRHEGKVVACGALHVCWGDLGEIKAVSVAEEWQGRGLGTKIVEACIEEARRIGLSRIFCLTYRPGFFARFGFREVDRMELPRKVWGECQKCPKFPFCDETAMILDLGGPQSALPKGRAAEGGEILESREVFKGRLLSLRVDKVRLPSGREAQREIVRHPDCVAIVPVDREENVILVRQYRWPASKVLLEIPAGKIEPGESPEQAAWRELWEETGLRPGTLEKIAGFYTSPGFCTEFMHLFLALELEPAEQPPPSDEIVETVRIPSDRIEELIERGEICDSKSLVGLLLWLDLRGRSL